MKPKTCWRCKNFNGGACETLQEFTKVTGKPKKGKTLVAALAKCCKYYEGKG